VRSYAQKRFIATGLVLLMGGCKADSFAGYSPEKKSPHPPPPSTIDAIPTGSVVLSCEPESVVVERGNTNPQGVPVFFQSTCSDSIQTTDVVSSKRPVDVVFVLDVTKSMQLNIDAVKNNVVEFAKRIGTKGWDARFVGVAYRDPPGSTPGHIGDPNYELLYSTAFMNDAQLAAEISSGKSQWIANDKSDNQEGGQAAISKAIDILNSGRRAGADAVILFVTDAPSFAGNNHWDFTITALASKMAAVSNLKFYHSTLATFSGNPEAQTKYGNLPADSRWMGDKSFNIARNQVEALRRASGKSGSWLEFPLRQSTFIDTLPSQFETVINTLPGQCSLSEAKLFDAFGQPVLSFEGDSVVEVASSSVFSFSAGVMAPGVYTYAEKRCCVREGSMFRSCEKYRERQATLTVR
jgi:hypothetical protein